MADLFLGLDCSTQSLSALVLDTRADAPVYEASINFEQALPHWGVRHGALPDPDPNVAHAPPLMWVEALVRMLDTLKTDGRPMGDIVAISGSGQQHGSVYLNDRFAATLAALGPRDNPVERLASTLSRPVSPIWMDTSTARERVRARYGMSWDQFSAALRRTPPGNGGALMLPWFEPEIVPRVLVPAVHRIRLDANDAAANCRAVVEGQALSMRRHSAWMGMRPDRLYATGGAAANRDILQVIADIHRCPVYRHGAANSAALGAAIRAVEAVANQADWDELIERFAPAPSEPAAVPRPNTAACYAEAEDAYGRAEESALRDRSA